MTAVTAEQWRSWPESLKRDFLQRAATERARRLRASWQPYPWQRPHEHPDDHDGPCTEACAELPQLQLGTLETWLMMGGRGTGKTDGGSQYVLSHVDGPACDRRAKGGHKIAIVAPTLGDAAQSCVEGVSGLIAHDPRVRLIGSRGSTFALFPNGARARLYGANTPDDVNRLRAGGNNCLVWLEEAAAMRHLGQVLEHTAMGLRTGSRPHYVITTTPKARSEVREWLQDDSVHITRGTTDQAHHLSPEFRDAIMRRYAGTTTGRQELGGEVLDDVEGALWKRSLIDPHRVNPTTEPPLRRVVVAIDPNAGGPDECGLVVVGLARDKAPDARGYQSLHLYVLQDATQRFSNPGQWASTAVQLYRKWGADAIVAEVNNGGDMVPHTIRTVDAGVPVRVVHATRGKAVRAEPVVALYEQGRVHHVGIFPQLEDQQTTWTPDSSTSPDRMDALVWACTDLAGLAADGGRFEMV